MKKRTKNDVFGILASKKDGNEAKRFLYQLSVIQSDAYMPFCLEWLESNLNKELGDIVPLKREKNKKYNNWESHSKSDSFNSDSNRGEELFVLKLFDEYKRKNEKIHPIFGELLDYQVPLKNEKQDKGYGKIDFVSVDRSKRLFYINEIKSDYNGECILRPIIEIASYDKMFDHKKILADFECIGYEIIKRIIIFENTKAHREYIGTLSPKYNEKLKELINNLKVEVLVIRQKINVEKVN